VWTFLWATVRCRARHDSGRTGYFDDYAMYAELLCNAAQLDGEPRWRTGPAGQCQVTRKPTPLGHTNQRPRSGDGVADIRLGSAGRNDEELRRRERLFSRGRAPSASLPIYNIRCVATHHADKSGASEQNMIFSSKMRHFRYIASRQLQRFDASLGHCLIPLGSARTPPRAARTCLLATGRFWV
jgi:hypothetical protein